MTLHLYSFCLFNMWRLSDTRRKKIIVKSLKATDGTLSFLNVFDKCGFYHFKTRISGRFLQDIM